MRISDWSSDVCSSDLCRPRPGLLDHQVADTDRIGSHGRNRQGQGDEDGWQDCFHDLLPARMGEWGCSARRGASFACSWPSSRKAFRVTITVAPRSEEHTSELQSLMRISYDVFCLKKKKTTAVNNNAT